MAIEDIYNAIVAENSRDTRHRHHLDNPTIVMRGVNPTCGDDISLELVLQDGIVKNAAFTGEGCAISQASATMMIDLVLGKTVAEATALFETFTGMIKGEVTDETQLATLEDAEALKGVSTMPARVKCATLAWHTLHDAIDKAKA